MPKKFSIIVAVDQKNGIGKDGKMPWVLPSDMKHFKAVTLSSAAGGKINAVIMGRKTWESLPDKWRPLPGRLNVVLTKNRHYPLPADVLKFHDLDESLHSLNSGEYQEKIDQIFVVGGANVYAQAVAHPLCQKIYLTSIAKDFDCDVSFPDLGRDFKQKERSAPISENGINYFFTLYER